MHIHVHTHNDIYIYLHMPNDIYIYENMCVYIYIYIFINVSGEEGPPYIEATHLKHWRLPYFFWKWLVTRKETSVE